MRLLVSKSANASSFYVQKDIKKGNSRTTVIVEKDIYHFNQFTTALDLIRFVKK